MAYQVGFLIEVVSLKSTATSQKLSSVLIEMCIDGGNWNISPSSFSYPTLKKWLIIFHETVCK